MVMQPVLLPKWNKVWMSSFRCICTVHVSICQNLPYSDTSRILVDGLSYYTVVYGLNCRRLKDGVAVHQGVQWIKMKDHVMYIHYIGAGYE